MSHKRFDGIVLYEPSEQQLNSVVRQLILLEGAARAVVDNSVRASTQSRVDAAMEAASISVIRSRLGNVGTSGGLNQLASEAASQSCNWLHYLDQDSIIDDAYRVRLEATLPLSRAAIIGCVHIEPSHVQRSNSSSLREVTGGPEFTNSRMTISSGSAYRVSTLLRVGGFDSRLFLDLVDHEFCLRVRRAGGQVLVDNRRTILHPIGEHIKNVGPIGITTHPKWRRRLMWRNSILLAREYIFSFPGEVAKHLAVRIGETILTASLCKDPSVITAAILGTSDALVSTRQSTHPWRP